MEIAPVASVRLTPMLCSKARDLGLTDIYEVESTSRSGDETYTPDNSEAASGFEDDAFSEPDEESEAQDSGPIKINCFV